MTDPQGKPGGKSEILFFQSEDGKKYTTSFYNLDVILSVGLQAIPPPRSSRNAQTRRSRIWG